LLKQLLIVRGGYRVHGSGRFAARQARITLIAPRLNGHRRLGFLSIPNSR